MAQAPKSFQQTLQELWALLRAYATQETVGPLKNLGRQIGFGLAGSILIAIGVSFLALGILRFVETHVEWAEEHDWLGYVASALFLCLVAFLGFRRAKGKGKGVVQATPASASIEASTAAAKGTRA